MMLKEAPIRSRKYLNGANGSPCTFMGPTCNADPATTVFAHLNGAAFGKGAGIKAHDIAGLDACSACHSYIDVGHGTKPQMSEAEFWWHLLRGVVLTMVNRTRRQIVIVPLDPEHLSHERPVPARKPEEQRAKIAGRGFDKTKSRRMNGTVTKKGKLIGTVHGQRFRGPSGSEQR